MSEDSHRRVSQRNVLTFDDDSEKSYFDLISHDLLADHFLKAFFSLWWLFICSIASFGLLFIYSYKILFNWYITDYTQTKIMLVILNTILFLDISTLCIFAFLRKTLVKSIHRAPNMFLSIIDILSLYTTMIDISGITDYTMLYINAGFHLFRNYRIAKFYYVTSSTCGLFSNNIAFITKYALMHIVYMHIFVCTYKYFEINFHFNNTIYNSEIYEDIKKNMELDYANNLRSQKEITPFEEYFATLYYVMGDITSAGFGFAGIKNISEQLISTAIQITALRLNCQLIGDLFLLKKEVYKHQTDFSNRLQSIVKYLSVERVPKKINKRIITFYISLWEEERALTMNNYLHDLPRALQEEIFLDKFWYAINQVSIFADEPVEIKRIIAKHMRAESFNKGDIILEQGADRHSIYFVARGMVSILSEEDGESSLLSLGVGASFGESCLFYIQPCRFSVKAQSYTVVFVINAANFWRIKELRKTRILNKMLRLMRDRILTAKLAKELQATAETNENQKRLVIIKNILIDEGTLDIYDARLWRARILDRQPYDSYILSSIQSSSISDKIFFKSTWPWKFQERSNFMVLWESAVVVSTILMLLVWPLKLFLYQDLYSFDIKVWEVKFTMINIVDVIIQLMTVYETPKGIKYTFFDILRCRASIIFFADILAAFPVCLLFSIISFHKVAVLILRSLKLLKLGRIANFLWKIERRYLFIKITRFRIMGHILLLLATIYLSGCLYFIIICYDGDQSCRKGSRIAIYLDEQIRIKGAQAIRDFEDSKVLSVMFFSVMLVTQTNKEEIGNYTEIIITTLIAYISMIFLLCISADILATSSLTSHAKKEYLAKVSSMQKFMQSHNIHGHIEARTLKYLEKRLMYNRKKQNRTLLHDLPEKIYNAQQISNYIKLFQEVPLFNLFGTEILQRICTSVRSIFLPAGEILVYGGVLVDEIYVIEQGICEVNSPVSGKLRKRIGSKQDVCLLEVILKKPNVYDVLAVTDVVIMVIRRKDFITALSYNNDLANEFTTVVNAMSKDLEMENRTFSTKHCQTYARYIQPKETGSWVFFPKKNNSPASRDFYSVFSHADWTYSLQYILMRSSLKPDGRVLFYWEIFRTFLIWCKCFIVPLTNVICYYFPNLILYAYIIDFFLCIDIYLQMHVCYYNVKGILVSHPLKTAEYYFKTRFLADLIGMLPMNYLLILFIKRQHDVHIGKYLYKYGTVSSFNLLLLVPRTRCLILNGNPLRKRSFAEITGYIIFILSIYFNWLATVFMNESGVYVGNGLIIPKNGSWIQDRNLQVPSNVDELYMFLTIAYRSIATDTLQFGFQHSLYTFDPIEIIFGIYCAISGYFFFIWVLVFICGTFEINEHVTSHNERLASLELFCNKENVSKELKQMSTNFYENTWLRTQGVCKTICKITPISIQMDIALHLYESTLSHCTLFMASDLSFKRRLGLQLKDLHLQTDVDLIQVNDIVRHLYIIDKGEVDVFAPNGEHLARMGRGSIFGNMDDIYATRSMVTVRSCEALKLAKIKTSNFYGTLDKVVDVEIIAKLKKHLHLISSGFFPSQDLSSLYSSSNLFYNLNNRTKLQMFFEMLNDSVIFILFQICCIAAAYVCVTYNTAFNFSWTVKYISLALDWFTVFKVLLDLLTSFRFRKKIKLLQWIKLQLKNPSMLINIISVVPFEHCIKVDWNYTTDNRLFNILHHNRNLRLINLIVLFRTLGKNMTRNALLMVKASVVSTCVVLLVHTTGCILYLVSCHDKTCNKDSWSYYKGNYICANAYICSIYYATSVICCHGHHITSPKTLLDCAVAIVFCTLGKFVYAACLSFRLVAVESWHYKRVLFDSKASNLQASMIQRNISPALVNRTNLYLKNMWKKNQGDHIPYFLRIAPYFLSWRLKYEAFGKHIWDNPIFSNCHEDFIRQLAGHIKLEHFFRNDIICNYGSINQTMYFIHKGEVEVISSESEEVVLDILSDEDSFGIIQGLHPYVEHVHTYRAINVSEILTLRGEDWYHLCSFFPASKFAIYNTLEIIGRH